MTDRRQLRATFDHAAATYHQARPRYPDDLFAALDELAELNEPVDVLEIGCGTGIASEVLAERGHRMTCLELGSRLADEARSNLARFSAVAVVDDDFDTWEPPQWHAFDLVVAATAWHWLDPGSKYERAHRHLRSDGSLAYWSAAHVVPDDGDSFFAEIQHVYDEIGEGLPDSHEFLRPGELPELTGEIEATGLFTVVGVRHTDWETTYDADGYLDLLDTFSGHIAMEGWKRERLDNEIRRRLAARPDGLVRRHWGAVLHVARRLA